MTQWPMRMSRARLFVLIDALEEDLRGLISQYLVPELGEVEALGHYAVSAQALMSADPLAGADAVALTDFLYLQESVAILNSRRDLLPSDLADAVRLNTPGFDTLSPVRNRVMHGRPLQPEDPDRAVELGNALLSTGCEWPNIADVLSRLNDDPNWEPAYLPKSPLRERVIHNLPLPDFDETGLIGRGREVRDLLTRLMRRREPVLTIIGEGGVGKTALAVKVLYDLIDHPDCPYEAVLWTSLKTEALTTEGIRPLLDAATGIRGMVAQLASPIDETFEGGLEELREVLEGVTTLVVVDNLETADSSEVLSLFDNLPDDCSFLFTSRIGLGQLERRITLPRLSTRDASALFRQLSRQRGLHHLAKIPDPALVPIVESLRRNPLALKWYVLSVEAGDEPDLALENQDLLLEFCVRSVYDALSEYSRELLINIFSLDRPVLLSELAVLSSRGAELDELRQSLHELQRSSLVETEAEIADRVSQAFSLSPSATQFVARIIPPDDDRRSDIRARDQELRTRAEARKREGASSALAPTIVHVRSHLDVPVADLLAQALDLAHNGKDEWRSKIATAARLAPGYFEVARVHAFIESTAGRVQHATSLYEQALDNADENERPIVEYFFAGHLARKAMDPAAALLYAESAATHLKEDRAVLQYGTVLMYLQRFDEAEERFEQVAGASDGRTRLIAITNLVSLDRRKSEWIRSEQHNPLLAAQTALRGVRRGMQELGAGVQDRKLTSAIVQSIADGLGAVRNMSQIAMGKDELIELVRVTRLNERRWRRSDEWKYVRAHVDALRERTDLPHEVATLLDERNRIRPEGVGQQHQGSVQRMIIEGAYGFIRAEGLEMLDVYFNARSLKDRRHLIYCVKGARVRFVLLHDEAGARAATVVLDEAQLPDLLNAERFGFVLHIEHHYALLEDEATTARVFMNRSGPVGGRGFRGLEVGQRLQYRFSMGDKGPRVVNRSARPAPEAESPS